MIYRFDDFELNIATYELKRSDRELHVEPQTLRLLHYLIEHRSKVVSRDDLIQAIWSGRAVSDWAVAAAIKSARAALGDNAASRRYIRTVHGKGVRFVGLVEPTEDLTPQRATAFEPSNALYLLVLPLTDFSEGHRNQYLADGITEDVINDLGRVANLRVASRNASFRLGGMNEGPESLFQTFGFTHILEGSIRKSDERFRINLHLIETASDRPVWSDRFDGVVEDVFDFQDDICAKIARALKIQFSLLEKRRGTKNKEAYEHCLRGRSEYYQYKPPNLAKALKFFEAATLIESQYAEAYAYQAYCRTSNYVFAWPGSDEDLQPALELAEKAIGLDGSSAVSYTRLGWTLGFLGERERAFAAFERALELDPKNAEVWHTYGETLNRLALPQKALQHLESAFSIDSFVPPSWDFARGHSHALLGNFEQALEHILPVLERVPGFVPAHVQLTRVYAEMGQLDKARNVAASVRQFAPRYGLNNALRMFPYPDRSEFERFEHALRSADFPVGI